MNQQQLAIIGFGQVVIQQVTVVDTICSLIERLSPTVSESMKEEAANLVSAIRRYGTALQTAPNSNDVATLRTVYGLVTSAPINDLMEASSLKAEVVKLRDEIAGFRKQIEQYEKQKMDEAENYVKDKKTMQDTIDSLQATVSSLRAFIYLREMVAVFNWGVKSHVGKRVSLRNLEKVVQFADFVYAAQERQGLPSSVAMEYLQTVQTYTCLNLTAASSQCKDVEAKFSILFGEEDTAECAKLLAGLRDKKKKLAHLNKGGFANAKRLLLLLRNKGVPGSLKELEDKIDGCRNDAAHLLNQKDRELKFEVIVYDLKLAMSQRPSKATTTDLAKVTLLSTDEPVVMALVTAIDDLLIDKQMPLAPDNFDQSAIANLPM